MIEWAALTKSLGYDSETAFWQDLYVEKKLSIAQLSRKLDVSRNVIRDCLKKAGVTSRKRGGPNNSKVVLTEELIEEVRKDGIAVVAKRLEMDYTTLYKRLYKRGITVASLRAPLSQAVLGTISPPNDKASRGSDINVNERPILTDPSQSRKS